MNQLVVCEQCGAAFRGGAALLDVSPSEERDLCPECAAEMETPRCVGCGRKVSADDLVCDVCDVLGHHPAGIARRREMEEEIARDRAEYQAQPRRDDPWEDVPF